jgi:hypothetical protein
MRTISVEFARENELSLVDFLRTGMSFEICCERHCWPPLATFNAFLQCGYDDVSDGSILRWPPFRLSDAEYVSVLGIVDVGFQIDALGTDEGDWQRWFECAVDLPCA